MPPDRYSNYPGRPRAIFPAACSATGGGARHRAREASAVLGRYVLGMQIPISRNEGTMAGTEQQSRQRSDITYVVNRRGKHVHHGRTVAAWTGTSIAMVAFLLGGIALVIQNWTMFWIAVALLVVSLIATKVLQVMGHGAR